MTTAAQDRVLLRPLMRPLAVAMMLGLSAGVATSLLQGFFTAPWSALVNAASPWLAVAFLAGALVPRPGLAALAGAVTCTAEVVGYYLTAAARDFPAAGSTIVLWIVCGIIAGPVLAEAGRLRSEGGMLVRLASSGTLGACFLLEAIRYATVLHYDSRAALFSLVAVTVVVLGVLMKPTRDRRKALSRLAALP
jgi:ABC-type thiamin/hydroxymethylpyrimidine transport system permease subunit